MEKGGSLKVENGVITIAYGMKMDRDGDARAAAGISAEAFVDLPEILDESLKDNATAQLLAKWIDANKSLLPTLDKAI